MSRKNEEINKVLTPEERIIIILAIEALVAQIKQDWFKHHVTEARTSFADENVTANDIIYKIDHTEFIKPDKDTIENAVDQAIAALDTQRGKQYSDEDSAKLSTALSELLDQNKTPFALNLYTETLSRKVSPAETNNTLKGIQKEIDQTIWQTAGANSETQETRISISYELPPSDIVTLLAKKAESEAELIHHILVNPIRFYDENAVDALLANEHCSNEALKILVIEANQALTAQSLLKIIDHKQANKEEILYEISKLHLTNLTVIHKIAEKIKDITNPTIQQKIIYHLEQHLTRIEKYLPPEDKKDNDSARAIRASKAREAISIIKKILDPPKKETTAHKTPKPTNEQPVVLPNIFSQDKPSKAVAPEVNNAALIKAVNNALTNYNKRFEKKPGELFSFTWQSKESKKLEKSLSTILKSKANDQAKATALMKKLETDLSSAGKSLKAALSQAIYLDTQGKLHLRHTYDSKATAPSILKKPTL